MTGAGLNIPGKVLYWGKKVLNTVLQRHDTALSHSFGLYVMIQ